RVDADSAQHRAAGAAAPNHARDRRPWFKRAVYAVCLTSAGDANGRRRAQRRSMPPPLRGVVACAPAADTESDRVATLDQPVYDVLAVLARPRNRFSEAAGDPAVGRDADAG